MSEQTDGDLPADESATMRAVDHTPPHGEGANRVWKRGMRTRSERAELTRTQEEVPTDE